jgi:hypothetical protein
MKVERPPGHPLGLVMDAIYQVIVLAVLSGRAVIVALRLRLSRM